MQERKEGKEKDEIKQSTLSLPFEVSLIRGGAFGSIEWILQHKILRKDVFHWRDIFAISVWPPFFQTHLLQRLREMSNKQKDESVARKKSVVEAVCPDEINNFYGYVDSVHVEAVLYVFKKYIYKPSIANNDLAAFIHGFVQAGQNIDDIHPKSGLLSPTFINWPENSNQQFNGIMKVLTLLRNMAPILHKKRMSMPTDKEFFQWWHSKGNDRTVLLSLSKNWVPPPAEVVDCINGMVFQVEKMHQTEIISLSVESVLIDVLDIFVETGFTFVHDLIAKERTLAIEMKEESALKAIRSTLRDIVRQVEATSPTFKAKKEQAEIRSVLRDVVRKIEEETQGVQIQESLESNSAIQSILYDLIQQIETKMNHNEKRIQIQETLESNSTIQSILYDLIQQIETKMNYDEKEKHEDKQQKMVLLVDTVIGTVQDLVVVDVVEEQIKEAMELVKQSHKDKRMKLFESKISESKKSSTRSNNLLRSQSMALRMAPKISEGKSSSGKKTKRSKSRKQRRQTAHNSIVRANSTPSRTSLLSMNAKISEGKSSSGKRK
jgi:hypothetical protein